MTNKEKFIEVFGDEPQRQYATKSWWEQEYKRMSDLISRDVVIDTIHRFFTEEVDKIPTKKTEDGEVIIICKAQPLFAMNKTLSKRIKALPSVPAERTGNWEWLTEDKYRCSNCNSETRVDECMDVPMYEFCPFCGVKMESEDKDGNDN